MKMKRRFATTAFVAAILAGAAGCSMMGQESMGATQQVSLSGANEVPPVSTAAAGSGTVTVNADHTVTAKITATGMAATASHIHMGAAGVNGPVIVPFTKTGDNTFEAPPGAKMTDEQYAAFKAGNTYVNVHSAEHKGGEIRAQLKGS